MAKFNSQTSYVILILSLFLLCNQVMSGANGYEEVDREKREPPTRYPNRVNDFLITQDGQIIVATVLGVTGYLCCVILPCCLGACSILLLRCMNLVEYPDTPVQKRKHQAIPTAHINKEKQGANEEDTSNKAEHPQSIPSTHDPVAGAASEHLYYPMQTHGIYPYLPYQLSYVAQGAQTDKLSFTNPMYNITQECQVETMYYNVVPMEPGCENCDC